MNKGGGGDSRVLLIAAINLHSIFHEEDDEVRNTLWYSLGPKNKT